ncbi:MAG: alpha/beta hydrolase family protein [Opitutales bacterium]
MKYPSIRSLIFGMLAVLLGTTGVLSAQNVKRYTVEELFKDPLFSGFVISPEADSMLAIAPSPSNGYRNIFIIDLATNEIQQLTNEKRHVINAGWFTNDRVFFGLLDEGRDSAGLWAVNKDGSRYRELVEPVAAARNYLYRYTFVIDILEDDPEHCLVISNERLADYPDVYIMKIMNGRKKIHESNPGDVVGWLTDHKGQVRIAVAADEETEANRILFRGRKGGDWEVLEAFDSTTRNMTPVGFAPDNRELIMSSNLDANTRGIFFYDPKKRELGDLIYRNPDYDVGGVRFSPKDDRLVGITYNAEKPKSVYFDEKWAEWQAMVDQALPDSFNVFASVDDNEEMAVIAALSDRRPPVFYRFDLKNPRLIELATAAPWINPADMVPAEPYSFETSDGLTLHGYLSLPHSYEAGNPVPLVAMPHGGPWARDTWGYDPWVQFLANRGFAVLKVNFRGSTGYGHDLLRASYKNVEAMNRDVYEAVMWAIDQGYADPERLGVMGASWGGYATMAQLAYYPGTYDFGINIFGVVDFIDHINTYRGKWDRDTAFEVWARRIGDPDDPEDSEKLKALSPIHFVDRIDVPVFIYHGTRDINVDISQSRMLEKALKRENVPVDSIYFADEAHTIALEENRLETFNRIEAFLEPFMP